VSHPAPGVLRPSYVGLAWSYDPDAARYRGEIGLQDPRVERIHALGSMVEMAAYNFLLRNRRPPLRIILFRDGLSDAEFDNVGGAELQDMKDNLRKLYDRLNKDLPMEKKFKYPTITYIFVVKR
jgi:eukaryotic translation initiation factor 2C